MRARAVAWAITLLAAAACATGTGESEPQGQGNAQLEILIDNNLIPPSSLDVFLVPRSGIERSLGNVIGSGTRRLYYRGLPLQGEYRLVAKTSTNQTISSNIVVLDHVTGIQWDVLRNFLEIKSVDEE